MPSFFKHGISIHVEARDADGVQASAAQRNVATGLTRLVTRSCLMTSILLGSMWSAYAQPNVFVSIDGATRSQNERVHEVVKGSMREAGMDRVIVRITEEGLKDARNEFPAISLAKGNDGSLACNISLKGEVRAFNLALKEAELSESSSAKDLFRETVILHEIGHCETRSAAYMAAESGEANPFLHFYSYVMSLQRSLNAAFPAEVNRDKVDAIPDLAFERQADLKAVLSSAWASLRGKRSAFDIEYGLSEFDTRVDQLIALRQGGDSISNHDVKEGRFSIYDTTNVIEMVRGSIVAGYRAGRGEYLEKAITAPELSGEQAVLLTVGSLRADIVGLVGKLRESVMYESRVTTERAPKSVGILQAPNSAERPVQFQAPINPAAVIAAMNYADDVGRIVPRSDEAYRQLQAFQAAKDVSSAIEDLAQGKSREAQRPGG